MSHQQCKGIFLCVIFIIFVTNVKPYVANDSHINIDNKSQNLSSKIATEGGVVPLTDKKAHESTITNPLISNGSTEASEKEKNQKLKVIMPEKEGREGVSSTEKLKLINNTVNTTAIKSTTEKIIPVKEEQPTTKTMIYVKPNVSSTETPIEYNGDSKIKPRKGAPTDVPEIFNQTTTKPTTTTSTTTTPTTTTSTTTKSSTAKPRKMKPTVTIGSDDEPYPPSNFVPHTQKKEQNNSDTKPKQDFVTSKYFKKGPDYVLPIVLTILAVPLFAILIAVLYKRGSEWWQHRHYRRMDFLIDGMYNN